MFRGEYLSGMIIFQGWLFFWGEYFSEVNIFQMWIFPSEDSQSLLGLVDYKFIDSSHWKCDKNQFLFWKNHISYDFHSGKLPMTELRRSCQITLTDRGKSLSDYLVLGCPILPESVSLPAKLFNLDHPWERFFLVVKNFFRPIFMEISSMEWFRNCSRHNMRYL